MYEKFGEFDSAEEMNRAAAAQFAEGDEDAIRELGKENGLEPEDVEAYIEADEDELVNPVMAAVGKIKVESEQPFAKTNVMEDWKMQILNMAVKDEALAKAVRRKEKSLEGCYIHILKWSFKNMKDIDRDILKECGIAQRVSDGNPSMKQARQLIRAYYLGEGDPQ